MEQNSKMIILDGDAVLRCAEKLSAVLEGESLPVVMQALGYILAKGDFERCKSNDVKIITADKAS